MSLQVTENRIVELIVEFATELGIDPKNLAWNEFQKGLSRLELSLTPKQQVQVRSLGGFSVIKRKHFGDNITPETLINRANALKSSRDSRTEASLQLSYATIGEKIANDFAKPIYKLEKLPARAKHLERNVNLMLSDLHIGSDLKTENGTRQFSTEEEASSMATLYQGLLDFKSSHRKESKLFVSLIGDLISGSIHETYASAPLAEQITRTIHLLGRMMHLLASEYPEVEVNCATGNHDRISSVNPDRVASNKWNSWASIIYYSVKQQMLNVPNFKMNIPKAPYFTYETFNHLIWATHGDTVINVPNLGPINTKLLESQVNALNAGIEGKKVEGLLFGHSHSAAKLTLSNGVTVIVNPPFIPADQYALSIGIGPDSPTGQQAWESVPGFAFGDLRTLWISEKDRQNKNYLKIIPPYKGF